MPLLPGRRYPGSERNLSGTDGIHIYQIFQVFVIPCLDLLDLVGCTESVEEVNERKFSFQCCTVCNRCQVHNLLYAGLTQHRCAGLAAGIYIRVISEDGKCVACKRTCGYVEYARELLAGYFVQVRDHKKKSLRSCKCCRKGTCCQRSVYSACRTCLGLHLYDIDCLSEDILSALCRPFVNMLRHNG